MPIDFPNSPSVNDLYSFGGKTWQWNGSYWVFYSSAQPFDIYVTGGTYSNGTAIFTNNSGTTFNVTGFSTSNATQFTGGTVSGATNFTGGLTANTISGDGSGLTNLNISALTGNTNSVQARRTSGYTLTNTFVNITLNITDIENDPTIISHDNVNTDRIYMYQSGLYELHYHCDIGQGTTVNDFETRLFLNDLSAINGSSLSGKSSSTDRITVASNTIFSATSGNYITLQARFPASTGGIITNAVLSVKQLRGIKGDTGSTGPQGPTGIGLFTGGTITGSTNFTGGLTANTISATTYNNLPTDIRVTGGTKSGSIITFTNNTGGTFNVTGMTDTFVTGGTYSNNTFTYTNNTGGTFNVSFNTLTGATINGNLTVTGTTQSTTFSGTTISGGTFYGDSSNVQGMSVTNILLTQFFS